MKMQENPDGLKIHDGTRMLQSAAGLNSHKPITIFNYPEMPFITEDILCFPMFRRFAILAVMAAFWLTAAWALRPAAVQSFNVMPPKSPDAPMTVTLVIQSLLPPDERTPMLLADASPLILAHRRPVRFGRLSAGGPLWFQTVHLVPASLDPAPASSLLLPEYHTSIPLPDIQADACPELPAEPLFLDCAPIPPHSAAWPSPFMASAVSACALLVVGGAMLARRRRSPAVRLRHLPRTRQSLDELPALLAAEGVTPATHPELFKAIDTLRFSLEPPSAESIETLFSTLPRGQA